MRIRPGGNRAVSLNATVLLDIFGDLTTNVARTAPNCLICILLERTGTTRINVCVIRIIIGIR